MKIRDLFALTAVVAALGGCATMKKFQENFDKCEAMKYVTGAQSIADGASLIVCNALSGEKKAKCLQERQRYMGLGSTIIGIGAGVLKACGISHAPPSVELCDGQPCAYADKGQSS